MAIWNHRKGKGRNLFQRNVEWLIVKTEKQDNEWPFSGSQHGEKCE